MKLQSMILVAAICLISGCSAPPKTGMHKGSAPTGEVIIPKAASKSFQKELAGTWNVISMRRQQKAALETLTGVTLQFNEADAKFTGKAPCNRIFGNILLNGYGIRFQNIGATKMACDSLEQETAYINLLQNRISAFTIDADKLYLRDGISNIVFECVRVK